MRRDEFEPRIAVREEKRQANEALGRSFCKTLTELITNSDSSGKRKHRLPQSSGLVDLILATPKGAQLDTAALKEALRGKHVLRTITLEVVRAQGYGRRPREIAVIDDAEGMSAETLKVALEDIGGDRKGFASGMVGRNLFGRGLSDVMRAHGDAEIQTYGGGQLSIAKGVWADRWKIVREIEDNPGSQDFERTLLTGETAGTAVRFIASSARFRIPDPSSIVSRLSNFYMLRLIAADPNVTLTMREYRAAGITEDRVVHDFPIGQVVESFTRMFEYETGSKALRVEFLLARSQRKLEGPGPDRDARENGLLIVDEFDAVYDLTFVDPDYERADFLSHIYGIIRIHGLRALLEAHLNSPDFPTSPLRVDRDGFNREHDFSKKLLAFLGNELVPCYERERKRLEESDQSKLSQETRKRIDEALKKLNKYFQQITEKVGAGSGADEIRPEAPTAVVSFLPRTTRLITGQSRRVVLLVRDDVVIDGAELVASATEPFVVEPETDVIYRRVTPRWLPHPNFFGIPFRVTGQTPGQRGAVTALVDAADGQTLEAVLTIEDVLDEPIISPPDTMEFRPTVSTGRPGRRNSLTLYVNPAVITPGHWVRFRIVRRTGAVELMDNNGTGADQLDVKLAVNHQMKGQNVLRVRVPWRGTAWNQHATVEARVKIGPEPIIVQGRIRLDEPDPNEAGFFRDVKYEELDESAPSMFAAGIIYVNKLDPLNQIVFGTGATIEEARKEFDRRLTKDPQAQQRLASLLLDEMSFRMLQQLFDDNKLLLPNSREIAAIHDEINKHKFQLAVELHKALVK